MIIIFLVQNLFSKFTDLFVLNVFAFSEVWRFISAIFLHGSLIHLIYNIFALALFGSILESLIGGRKFLFIFFITGILANLIAVNFYALSLGASGAIFGVIGALIAIRPMLFVWAFGIPMPIFAAGILWGAGDLLGTYGFLIGNPLDNRGIIGHLSGMIFGLIFGFLFREKRQRTKRINYGFVLDENYMRSWEDRNLK